MYPGNSGVWGEAVFAPTCLCCYSLWAGLKAHLRRCHSIVGAQGLVLPPECSEPPQEGQEGTVLLRVTAPSQHAGRWKGLQENINDFFLEAGDFGKKMKIVSQETGHLPEL